MRITTLGPLAVDGRPVRGDRLAAVLRELIEARGRTVSTGALVAAVWAGDLPADAVAAVQALVGRVRRLGVPVLAAPGGYRISVGAVEVDAVLARTLTEHGRKALADGETAPARDCADRARALFPEVPDLSASAVARLFGDVVTLRAEAALAGGTDAGVADLRMLVTRVPPDEAAAALLVRVLAAQGRDAEALDLVEQVRAEVADRYGADPSPILAETHVALLRGQLVATRPRRPGTLPATWRRAATPLVGRDADVAAVGRALRSAPLVTIVATGGAGKTRLAAEIARAAAGSGPVHVVELAGLRSPAEVRPAVLSTFADLRPATQAAPGDARPTTRTAPGGPRPTAETAPDDMRPAADAAPGDTRPTTHAAPGDARLTGQAALGDRVELDGLLVLDNCEHLLDAAAAVVTDLLAVASPESRVLATSRAPLGLAGEFVHRLPALPDDEALVLLESRVRAAGSTPTWPRDRALALCHRLDNLPLALELAAARLRHLPIADVLAGLDDRFTLLDDALRGLPERHAGLWATVDWSRALLAPAEQDLLERLAVIPAPFTSALAAATAGDSDVRRGLSSLVDQSLLRLDGDRYRMLETVREYGQARLDDDRTRPTDGQIEPVDRPAQPTDGLTRRGDGHARHSDDPGRLDDDRTRRSHDLVGLGERRAAAMDGLVGWAVERAVTLAGEFIGPGQIAALATCAAEQENLITAVRWALEQDDEPAAVDVATALFQLWTVRGRHAEASALARTLLNLDDPTARRRSAIVRGRAAGRPLPHADRLAWLCVLIAVNAGSTGPARLIALARRALRVLLLERSTEVSARAAALAAALPGLEQADPDRSLADAAVLIARSDPYLQGMGFFVRAVLTPQNGAGDAELAYRRFEAIGDHWGMGMAAHAAGHAAGREEWLRRSRQHMELLGAAEDAEATRVLLDTQLALAGDAEAGHRLRTTAASDEPDAAQARLGLAELSLHHDRPDEALTHAEALISTTRDPAFRIAQAVILLWIAAARPAPSDPAAPNQIATAQPAPSDPTAQDQIATAQPATSNPAAQDQIATAQPATSNPAAPNQVAAGQPAPSDPAARDQIATARPVPSDLGARAADALRLARAEVLAAHDRPLLGAWAMGGAELAAFHGDAATARELWAMGTRAGATISRFFPQGRGARLAAALGDDATREPPLAEAARLTGAALHTRITARMDALLVP
ncbi:BTAD domain-containing putative transcriptional regulator [Actinoplanes sp. NPDC049265]|uniref:BTAD domain-containing putative transcriptional regulator n=1 Tax=Actinoplanes sp. NPDC049265 TaxID=3363902 RepID=UPI003713281E